MKTTKIVQIGLALALAIGLVAAAVSPALAQSPVTAEVDRYRLSTGETLTLSITVSGSNAGKPEIPMLDGFQVVGTSKSSQISIINGVISSQAVYHYVLQPVQIGALTIPGIPVVVDRQTYVTQPITVEVAQGTAPTAPQQNAPANPTEPISEEFNGQEVYVEAVVDNPNPYIGEQITHTFRFYRAINLFGQPTYEAPSFSGFWNESETQQVDYDVTIGNRLYRVVELTTVLFPTSAGEQTIEAAALTIPGSLFTHGTRLATNPIAITVQPLTSPTPEGFHGAVGKFTITTSLDTDQVTINEPVTLKVEIHGTGNISTLPDPEMPVLNNWRSYESTSTINTQLQDGQIYGSRITEQLMVPGSAGEFTLPAIYYTYFDPGLGDYQTVSSESLVIQVSEGAVQGLAPAVGTDPNGNSQPITMQADDIRYIKAVPEILESVEKPLITSWVYWSLWLLPVGAVAVDFAWQRRQRFRAENPDFVRSSRAQKKAFSILAQARKEKSDPYATIGQVLMGYLSDRFSQPMIGLTQTELDAYLVQYGVPPSLIKQIKELLSISEMGRFAPTAGQNLTSDELFKATRQLITRLEKVLD
jgi:hypothetical protein